MSVTHEAMTNDDAVIRKHFVSHHDVTLDDDM